MFTDTAYVQYTVA